MAVFAGDPILASDLNGVIALLPATYTKGSVTSRNTTTTLADDPELAGIPLAVGTYDIELIGFFTLATVNTQKLKTRWGFTGTWNNADRMIIGPGSAQVAAPANATEVNVAGSQASGQDAIYDAVVTVIYTGFREVTRNVIVTVAGNLSLQWAQSVSNAGATNVQAGTAFVVRKIS